MNFNHKRRIMLKAGKRQEDTILKKNEFTLTIFGQEREIDELGLYHALVLLTPREEAVIRFRFGIHSASLSLEEVACVMGVSRERIRQIEAKAIRILRHPKKRRFFEL